MVELILVEPVGPVKVKQGEDLTDLKPSVIVFICTFDPFGYHLYRYTSEKRCKEVDTAFGDDTKTIFLSTEGDNGWFKIYNKVN